MYANYKMPSAINGAKCKEDILLVCADAGSVALVHALYLLPPHKGVQPGLLGIDGIKEDPSSSPSLWSKTCKEWAVIRSGRDQWFSKGRGKKLLPLCLEAMQHFDI